MRYLLLTILLMFTGVFGQVYAQDNAVSNDLRLYRLDCGYIYVSDLNVFSINDAYVGQTKEFVDSCYLIKHGEEWLLWDTGLPSSLVETPEGHTEGPFTAKVKVTIAEQLKAIGITIEDIDYVGLSHTHFDHSGNVNLFKNSKLVLQKKEYETLSDENGVLLDADHVKAMSYFLASENKNQLELIEGDVDFFKDGSVKMVSLPGHTEGHMALIVSLPKAGDIVLSGDQWHFTENRKNNGVPSFNSDREQTLESSAKLEKIILDTSAMLVIQHEGKDNLIFSPVPEYLD